MDGLPLNAAGPADEPAGPGSLVPWNVIERMCALRDEALRKFGEAHTALNAAWRDLPAGSFREVGTNVNTVILRVWKSGARAGHWW